MATYESLSDSDKAAVQNVVTELKRKIGKTLIRVDETTQKDKE